MLKMSNSLACGSVRTLENAIRPLNVSAAAGADEREPQRRAAGSAVTSAPRRQGRIGEPVMRSTISAPRKAARRCGDGGAGHARGA